MPTEREKIDTLSNLLVNKKSQPMSFLSELKIYRRSTRSFISRYAPRFLAKFLARFLPPRHRAFAGEISKDIKDFACLLKARKTNSFWQRKSARPLSNFPKSEFNAFMEKLEIHKDTIDMYGDSRLKFIVTHFHEQLVNLQNNYIKEGQLVDYRVQEAQLDIIYSNKRFWG